VYTNIVGTTERLTMNILYVHGFASSFDPTQEKIQLLETLGTVYGVNIDYTEGYSSASIAIYDEVMGKQIDLIVGTSMGGYMSAMMGEYMGIPFVAMNPAINPSETLKKRLGHFVDYNGNDKFLSEQTAASYPEITKKGAGLILLDLADEVLPARATKALLQEVFNVHTFVDGSHRFAHTKVALPVIKEHYDNACTVYGLNME
jgi:predicted esterase YcpF (UPF0227 family)